MENEVGAASGCKNGNGLDAMYGTSRACTWCMELLMYVCLSAIHPFMVCFSFPFFFLFYFYIYNFLSLKVVFCVYLTLSSSSLDSSFIGTTEKTDTLRVLLRYT